MSRPVRLTAKKDWSESFLAHMSRTGNVLRSCEAAGITRQAAYARRDHDAAFAAAWASAMEDAADVLEEIAWERGREQSDTLIIFLLKGLRPQKYRENIRQEVSGPNGGAIEIDVEDTRAELQRRLARLAVTSGAGDVSGEPLARGAGDAAVRLELLAPPKSE